MRLILTIAVLVGMLCHSVAHAAGDRIAVLELRGAVDSKALRLMTDEVRGGVLDAVRGGDFIVMTRENMAVMAKDMGTDLSCVEGECEVETARNIGAAYVVSGEVVDLGGRLNLVLKLHDTTEGALRSKRRTKADGVDALVDAASALGRAVTQEGLSLSPAAGTASAGPVQASGSVSFGGGLQMDVQSKLREKRCSEAAESTGKAQREAKLDDAARTIQAQAMSTWRNMQTELEDCTQLDYADRDQCRTAVSQWLQGARTAQVSLPDGEESVQTDCGQRVAVFAAEQRAVSISTQTAQSMLTRLNTRASTARSPARTTARPRRPTSSTPRAAASGSAKSGRRVLSVSDLTKDTMSEQRRDRARAKRAESQRTLQMMMGRASGAQKAELTLRLGATYMEDGRDQARSGSPLANASYLKALKLYQGLLRYYPQYSRADEVSFQLASALQETGNAEAANKELSRLVRSYPSSRYVPDAYVMMGEHYFDNNNAYKALLAYQKAAQYKTSPKYGFAMYKLAWCYYNVAEYGKAIHTMKSVVTFTESADKESQKTLQEAALKDLTRFFADAGEMDEAYAYFSKLGKKGLIAVMLSQLAETYFEQGKFEQAIRTYRRLIAEDPLSPKAPQYQGEIVGAYQKIGRRTETQAEAKRLIETYGVGSRWARVNAGDKAAIQAGTRIIEAQLRTLTLYFFEDAKKLGAGSMARASYQIAGWGYAAYLKQFPDGRHTYEMRHGYGELLYKLKKYKEAYSEYMKVVAMDSKGKHAESSAKAAIEAAAKMRLGGKDWEADLRAACSQYQRLFPTKAPPRPCQ